MTNQRTRANGRGRRHAAMIAGSLVAGALQAGHSLAWSGRVDGWSAAFMMLGVWVELEVLTAIFDSALWRQGTSPWAFAVSSVVGIGMGIAEAFAAWGVGAALGVTMPAGMRELRPGILAQLGAFNGVVGLGLWAIAVVIPFALRDANARALEAEQLRIAAELARLRANLQPHFLLNTLSTVAGLVTEDPAEARNLVGALGDLLRDSLEDADEMQTLEDEVAWLKRYAEILETRHRGSIRFSWDIAEATRKVRVPRLLLQPLLENAVKHGALRRRGGGEVAVRASLDSAGARRLTCVIEDNGPGPAPATERKGALGLELVIRRLALKYSGSAAFRLEAADGYTRSIVELPAEASP